MMHTACVQAPVSGNISNVLDPWANMPTDVTMLAPGVISTRYNDRDLAISPDGKLLLFTRVSPKNRISAIMQSRITDQGMSQPQITAFSGQYSDLEPAFSPDGNRLYFASNRPLSGQGPPKDFDIWFVEKVNTSWSEPINIGAPVNTDLDEYYPSLTQKGDLYFTGLYDRSESGENIYKSTNANGKFQTPVAINEKPSLSNNEFNAFVGPDESYLIFSSDRKKQGGDYADLYISFLHNGQWTDGVNLGEKINTSQLDYCPFVYEFNGKRQLFFTRTDIAIKNYYPDRLSNADFQEILDQVENGTGNIYRVSFDDLLNDLMLD